MSHEGHRGFAARMRARRAGVTDEGVLKERQHQTLEFRRLMQKPANVLMATVEARGLASADEVCRMSKRRLIVRLLGINAADVTYEMMDTDALRQEVAARGLGAPPGLGLVGKAARHACVKLLLADDEEHGRYKAGGTK